MAVGGGKMDNLHESSCWTGQAGRPLWIGRPIACHAEMAGHASSLGPWQGSCLMGFAVDRAVPCYGPLTSGPAALFDIPVSE